MPERVTFTVPLPPVELRANARAHWAKRKKAADEYSECVAAAYGFFPHPQGTARTAWKAAKVTYIWRYAGVAPDHGNLGGNTKYLQDILCVAPKINPRLATKYKRWHLGLVENDAGITAEYRMEKVKTRAEECVVVEIEKR